MAEPQVSVVVPCFNQGRFLAETIQSLQAQTLQEWECIIIDDGSTDETAKVARSLAGTDRRIRYIFQPNAGPSAARNRGLAMVRGAYVQFLDADDLLETDKLKAHVAYLQQSGGNEIVYGDARYFADGRPLERVFGLRGEEAPWIKVLAETGRPLLEKLIQNNIMPTECAMLPRSVIRTVGGFDEEIHGCEDWDFWMRCALAGIRFTYMDNPKSFALIRNHETSTSRDHRRMADGEFSFRLKIGKKLSSASLRLENMESAIRLIQEENILARIGKIIRSLRANFSLKAAIYAFLHIVDRRGAVRSLARSVRKQGF